MSSRSRSARCGVGKFTNAGVFHSFQLYLPWVAIISCHLAGILIQARRDGHNLGRRIVMRLPKQASPIIRGVSTTRMKDAIRAQTCSLGERLKCGFTFAGIVTGPCDPAGFPEDLPLCIPALAGFVIGCEDCIKDGAKATICEAVSLAEKARIPIPSKLRAFCG